MFAAVAGGEVLWLALLFIANRPRPTEITAVTGLKLPGFPSGHVMIYFAFFGALFYIYLHAKEN
jgi:membrane-associated phospholipid phosphatase